MSEINQLSLLVLNSEQLEGNSDVQHQFGPEGGTLGASDRDDWQLKERLGAVMPTHARIERVDGRFCLCDLSGQTFINGATSPVGRNRRVALQAGDELLIGPFRIRVFSGGIQAEPELDGILGNRQSDDIDDWFTSNPAAFTAHPEQPQEQNPQDDPLWVLQQEKNSAAAMLNRVTASGMLSYSHAISDSEEAMDQKFIELPDAQGSRYGFTSDAEVSLAPLMRGLGQTLDTGEGAQAQAMLLEMGKTLRAMVEGLLTLQAEQAALADKLLRPIEDNPLRLGLNYDDTLALLFAESKSPVHLSAPAAVAEVLANIRVHHRANQQAISAALESILEAFSPGSLLARFSHYRRSASEPQSEQGWAWEMYQHYFNELTSSRQQGFHKLFQQVYAQAYDRAVREQQEPK